MSVDLPSDWSGGQLLAALPPGHNAVALDSPEGRRLARQRVRGLVHLVLRELRAALHRGYRGRRAEDVVAHYEPDYAAGDAPGIAEAYGAAERAILFRFADHLARVEARYPLSLMTRLVGDVAVALAPQRVAEIGCGHGRALMHMASRLPGARCHGYELTTAGVQMARRLQALELPQTAYGKLYGITEDNLPAVRRATFETASAFDLPAADGSFDLVYTYAALEQMGDGLPKALAEIRRVSRKHVLLFEPFADFNDLPARTYLWSRNYFRMHSEELRTWGLHPVRRWRNVPVKPTFAYGLVLCEVK